MTKEEKFLPYLSAVALICIVLSLMPWAMSFLTYAINVDIAFLTLSADRLLSGEAMSEAYYDTNLPLSIIVQIPPVLLSSALNIPLYHATSIYIFILLGLSLFSTNLLLKKFDDLSVEQRVIILSVFLVMNTIKPGYEFGQKDHILGLALFPLVLAQILITKRIEFNNFLKICVLLAGAFLILLKPHYGVVPAAIFLHRMIYQKRFAVFLDIDFICLAGMAIGYVCAIFILFPDFIAVILPDILQYYASDISPNVVQIGIILMVQAIVPLAVCQIFLKKAHPLISVFSMVAVLTFIPFILQGKGWAYHAIPANVFFYCSAGLFIAYLVTFTMNALKIDGIKKTFSLLVITGLLLWIVSQKYEKQLDIPTHASYQNTEFVKILNDCEEECSFLVLHDMINVSQELSIYTGLPHASRLPTMWFTAFLLNAQHELDAGKPAMMNQQELNEATQKYTNMMAEDFAKYDPKTIFVGLVPNPANPDELFDFRAYLLEKNPEKFTEIWDRYELEKSMDVDRLDYMERKKPNEDLIRYNIYRKKTP